MSHTMITEILNKNGQFLTELQAEQFRKLTETMLSVNAEMNLTAITDPTEIAVKHYADCAAIAPIPPIGATVADIGAGAGFPTLPLGILRTDLHITAVDSTEKRMRYVANTAGLLGLKNVQTLVGRAEELAKKAAHREQYDFVTARAVANLNTLCELCLPWVKVGGIFCALKAADGYNELKNAEGAATKLGATLCETKEFSLTDPTGKIPQEGLKRILLLFEKKEETSEKYPRRYARIQSDPL